MDLIGQARGVTKKKKINHLGEETEEHLENDSEFISKAVVHNLVKIAEVRQNDKLKSNQLDVLFAGAVAG